MEPAEVSDEDMAAIRSMPLEGWSGQHPDRKNIDPYDQYK